MALISTEAADADRRALRHLGQQFDGVAAVRPVHLARIAFGELCPTRLLVLVHPTQ
jgi:hypothetical protein